MGIFSIPEHHHYQAVPPNTPPLPHLPKPLFDYKRRPTVPLSPPMSRDDRSPLTTTLSENNTMDERRDMNQTAATAAAAIAAVSAPPPPRTQLPSLSSLFGPPSQIRPLHSPLSDRHSPYSAPSPLDRPQTGGVKQERSLSASSSYFPPPSSVPGPPPPPPPPLSQPRSTYDGRYAPEPAPYPRSMPAPISPRTREVERPKLDAGGSEVGSSSRWAVHHDDRRHEYALGSRESGYKPAHAQPISQRPTDQEMLYRDQQVRHMANPPSTPISTASSSEGIPIKDGLGPKIWTGTHFLPRFVRAAEVAGEGMCYFYDDGSHCKTVIDGEHVNAHWGVTKAGKPRKRLAIACVTCREKKIKCDPDYPRCVQCEKFGRTCKFKNAPRGGHNSPGDSSGEAEDSARRMVIGSGQMMGMLSTQSDVRRPGSQSSASLSPRTHMMRPTSPEPPTAKRPRLVYETVNNSSYAAMAGDSSAMARTPESAKSSLSWQQPELPRIHEDVLMRAWQTDPYVTDPQSVIAIVASFMARIECTTLRFLPQKPFTSWVQSNAHRKSPADQMLIYSILAVGLVITPSATTTTSPENITTTPAGSLAHTPTTTSTTGPAAASAMLAAATDTNSSTQRERALAFDYAQVARYASNGARLGIQLVQARLLLSIYYLSISRARESNDMLSAAISAASFLQLNMELDSSREAPMTVFPYGLNKTGYEEMRRRTFWSCFVLERVNGLLPNRASIINTDDIFLRLPMALPDFQAPSESTAPFFESLIGYTSQVQGPASFKQTEMDVAAHLVNVAAIWGDVMTTTYRVSHRRTDYDFDFAAYYQRTVDRLATWTSSLHSDHSFTRRNLDFACSREETGTFVTMHLLYHLSGLKLNRHISPRYLEQDSLRSEHAARAKEHAREILEVVATLRGFAAQRPDMPLPLLASYALLESTDVLAAEGLVDEIPTLLEQMSLAREVQVLLANSWEEAAIQTRVTYQRIMALRRVLDHARLPLPSTPNIDGCRLYVAPTASAEKEGLCWQIPDPLELRFPPQMDVVYSSRDAPGLGAPRRTY
ncbi:hypothetical protein MKZ38_001569 [Zalerion maritima]|uniref:Zn(2)-C6 fungal-type domain-containing protein n=1 Tax=Zalerion maritima TaxID=339359 RepID=A0AAD5RRM9_9PEZI|nr:hypothetical protein MKZ38_001569 [Zalerion maritima]